MTQWCAPVPGVEDIFGTQAKALRTLQGCLLGLFSEYHYDEVIPPLLERPEVLLAGAGRFLMNNTLVLSDPAAHGQLAIRSDITPQLARIAATRLQGEQQLRLCYSGPVVQARGDAQGARRQQWQMGIERMGDDSPQCDQEVLQLAALSMLRAGFAEPVLQLGHVKILRSLCAASIHSMSDWIDCLQRRSPDDVAFMLAKDQLTEQQGQALLDLAGQRCDGLWLKKHRADFGEDFASAAESLLTLEAELSRMLGKDVQFFIDAALMPHFLYHSGLIFRAYTAQASSAMLCGGRYDDMMAAHGRHMPAIGFSFDLQYWLQQAKG